MSFKGLFIALLVNTPATMCMYAGMWSCCHCSVSPKIWLMIPATLNPSDSSEYRCCVGNVQIAPDWRVHAGHNSQWPAIKMTLFFKFASCDSRR